MGWGNIAKQLDVHPSFLGLGHSKYSAKHHLDFTKHTRMRSEIKAATARNFKGEAIRGHTAGESTSKHKNLGLATTKGRGNSNDRGLALGHSKSNGGGNGGGNAGGNGGGNN